MRSALRLSILLGLALALAAPSGSAAAAPVKIRAAWIATPASLIPILFLKPGLAKHNGVTYDFEPLHFQSTPTEISALAAGDIEIATLNFASFPIAVENAGMTDLRIIADETQDGAKGYATVQYMVLNDGPIKKVADLKGRIVAVNGIGTGVDFGMRAYLLHHGMQFKRDYTMIEVPFPNMTAVLMDHKADLVTEALPFVFDPKLQKNAHTLFTLKDGLGGSELSFWEARAGFIQKHRAAFVDLLEDTVRAYRWYSDPANHKEAVAILAKFTKQPAARLDWAFTKQDTYRDPDGLPNLAMLQRNVNTVKELGFIKTDLDMSKYLDLSMIKEGAARLK
ncbi:MAG TPA: ABC transporter substrate-binding protein [Stellaceae bacterium]|nr:ABC transporter substrate-binding protein [Stellaceae bacterium]